MSLNDSFIPSEIRAPTFSDKKKRKSSDGSKGDSENIAPNHSGVEALCPSSATKKPRSKPTSSTTVAAAAASTISSDDNLTASSNLKVRSGLPRYTQQRTSATASSISRPTVAAEKKRGVTEQSTAERRAPATTPGKVARGAVSASASVSDTTGTVQGENSTIDLLKRRLQTTFSGDTLHTILTGPTFSVTEEKVSVIISNLKVKSKWDVKEK